MPPSRSDASPYLISAGPSLSLQEVLQQISKETDVLETIGPAGAPHTAVLNLTTGQAQELARRFPQLTIEPDRPLSLFPDRE